MRAITLRLLHSLPPGAYLPALTEARALGADTVCLVPHYYSLCAPNTPTLATSSWSPFATIFAETGQMWPGIGNTPAFDNVVELSALVRSLGLNLWLKPHIDLGWWHEGTGWGVGGWRGYLSVPPRRAYRWWLAYRQMLKPYVKLARQSEAGLVLGCELLQITRDYGPHVWVDLALWIRKQGFTGPLSYAANWGEEVRACSSLWYHPAFTHIGCDWYVPLSQWDVQAKQLRTLQQAAGKPLLFTEVGFPNYPGAQEEPWHDWTPQDTPSDDEQLAGWEHFRSAWSGEAYIAWEGPVVGLAAYPVNHNVLRTEELARRALGA